MTLHFRMPWILTFLDWLHGDNILRALLQDAATRFQLARKCAGRNIGDNRRNMRRHPDLWVPLVRFIPAAAYG